MPIIDVQRRVAEIGRIRLGEQIEFQPGKTRPRALGRFRFTSPKMDALQNIAREYGGDVQRWESPSGTQYEVVTHAREVPVVLIPAEIGFSQWFELWSGAGCERRCDGVTESRGDVPRPCVCNGERGERKCKYTTRLSVLLPVVSTFGTWRLETHSMLAAGEMRTAIELALGIAARRGDHFAFGTLRVEDRVIRRPGEKPSRFTVPVLDVHLEPSALVAPGQPSPLAAASVHADDDERPGGDVDAAAALSAVSYPEPSPRIDRGSAGPPPNVLPGSEERRAPEAPPPASSAPVAVAGQGTKSPEAAPLEDDDTRQHREAVERNEDDEGVTFRHADTVPQPEQPHDERNRTMRRVFARMKDAWPDLEQIDREERRHAIAILATTTPGQPCRVSFAELTEEQLSHVEARVIDITATPPRIRMTPVPHGYAFTSWSGRTAVVTKDDSGEWSYAIYDQPPKEIEETF